MIRLSWKTDKKQKKPAKRAVTHTHTIYLINLEVAQRFAASAEEKLGGYDFQFAEVTTSEIPRS